MHRLYRLLQHNKAADELVNPDLVVPDDVTKGEIVQNVSQDARRTVSEELD